MTVREEWVSENRLEPLVALETVEFMLAWSNDFLGTGGGGSKVEADV